VSLSFILIRYTVGMNLPNACIHFRAIFLIGTIFMAASAAFPQRQNPGGANPPARAGGAPRGESSFILQLERNDKDNNGQLSFEEASTERMFRESLFKAVDTNSDGEISRQEAILADKIDQYQGPEKRITFEGKEWIADYAIGAQVVDYKGKRALHLDGREQCYVYLPIDDFQDGVIEVDIAGDIFSGIGFRGRENGQRVEKLYFRPQNAGTDRHGNTVQYAVIGREGGHWRDLRTQFPGKYETGADIEQGEWFHAKLVIKGTSLKVYLNDSENPVLAVDPMLDGVSKGSVGVWGWDSYFANFKYTSDSE
jgi:hypothetical protein